MTVDQLSCFLAVAEHKSFTEAAKHLYISHSAVSKAISSLEASLNVQLLIRDNRTVSLTPAGSLLEERGSQLLYLWRDLESRISNIRNNETGSLSFILPMLNNSQLFSLMRRMRELYPRVNLEVQTGAFTQTIPNLIQYGHADIGMTYSFAIPESCGLSRMTLAEDSFCLFCSYDHPVASLPGIKVSEALCQPMVFPPLGDKDNDFPMLHRIFRPMQEDDYASQDLEGCLFQVALGRGVAILPRSSVGPQHPVKEVPLTDLTETFTLDLIWNEEKRTTQMDLFLSLAEGLIDSGSLSTAN